MKPFIRWKDFEKIDFRCGTIISASAFPEAKKPAFILQIDFGDHMGIKKSSAQLTEQYEIDDLIGRQILAIINFQPKQIGPIMSECLVCGFYTEKGVVLVQPEKTIENGSILG